MMKSNLDVSCNVKATFDSIVDPETGSQGAVDILEALPIWKQLL